MSDDTQQINPLPQELDQSRLDRTIKPVAQRRKSGKRSPAETMPFRPMTPEESARHAARMAQRRPATSPFGTDALTLTERLTATVEAQRASLTRQQRESGVTVAVSAAQRLARAKAARDLLKSEGFSVRDGSVPEQGKFTGESGIGSIPKPHGGLTAANTPSVLAWDTAVRLSRTSNRSARRQAGNQLKRLAGSQDVRGIPDSRKDMIVSAARKAGPLPAFGHTEQAWAELSDVTQQPRTITGERPADWHDCGIGCQECRVNAVVMAGTLQPDPWFKPHGPSVLPARPERTQCVHCGGPIHADGERCKKAR